MIYLFTDVETAACEELEWKPPEDDPKKFPPLPYHRIIVIGTMLVDIDWPKGFARLFHLKPLDYSGCDERLSLEQFAGIVSKYHPVLVTYNGRGFDIPLINLRALHFGVPMPANFRKDFRYRYSDAEHCDVADQLCEFGASQRFKLGDVARLIGLPGKMSIDGSMTWEYFKKGRIAEIEEYCCLDVLETAFIFLRLQLLQGKISISVYKKIVQTVIESVGRLVGDKDARFCSDGYFSEALKQIDREVLLLEPEIPF